MRALSSRATVRRAAQLLLFAFLLGATQSLASPPAALAAVAVATSSVTVTPVDGGVTLTLAAPEADNNNAASNNAVTPEHHLVHIEIEIDSVAEGETPPGSFELAFEALEVRDSQVTIRGLENGKFYRLTVQGIAEAGIGQRVSSMVFVPGSSPEMQANLRVAHQALLDLTEQVTEPAAVAELARQMASSGMGPAFEALLDEPRFEDHRAIVRLYLGFLDRPPELEGIEFWFDQSRQGQDLTTIATRFASASQFELGSELSDQEFVERVYQTILGRPAELEGLAFWVERLNTGTARGRLLLEVSESLEHRAISGKTAAVIAAYVQLLDRVPSGPELENGVAIIEGSTVAEMLSGIIESAEFQARL